MHETSKSMILAALLSAVAGPALASSVTFDFSFPPATCFLPEGGTGPCPFLGGEGFMSFDDPGDGTHDFDALTNLSALFVLATDGDPVSFSMDDRISGPGLTAIIETQGDVRRLTFGGEDESFTANNGGLAFESPGEGYFELWTVEANPGGLANFFDFTNEQTFSLYSATAPAGPSVIPLPATLPLLAAGLGGLALLRRRVGAG